MQDIKQRELKMQEKRKNTPFRDFVKEIASRCGLSLYKKNKILSRYPETGRLGEEISIDEFENTRDDLLNHGVFYTEDFFKNFKELFNNMRLPPRIQAFENQNCDFADHVYGVKNTYLSFMVAYKSENILYSYHIKENCTNILNSVMARNGSNNVFFGVGIINGFNIFYSKFIFDSSNIRFSTNLMGCSECLFCDNLQNQSYCIENKQYTKEEYIKQKELLLQKKEQFLDWYLNLPVSGNNFASGNTNGSFVIESHDVSNSYMGYHLKNARNTVLIGGTGGVENAFDAVVGGSPSAGNCYGTCHCGGNSTNAYSTYLLFNGCSNIYYSYFLESCSYCLGCIGLKNKSFCILNKQYSKKERFELANKIFEQMDKDGTLGNYFPGYINPFYFNDTVAYLIDDSFTKEEVEKDGYLRRDDEIKVDIPAGADIVLSVPHPLIPSPSEKGGSEKSPLSEGEGARGGGSLLSDYQGFNKKGEREINPDILKKVIKDDKGNYYKIVPMELEFLQKYSLPLPKLHWLDRIKLGFRFK